MTDQEFNEWVRYHGDCVGGFTEWLAKGRDYTERATVLRRWQEALADVSLQDAKAASLAIMRGDIEVTAFGSHPKEIRRHAKGKRGERAKKQRRVIDGHEVVDCVNCLDSGFVLCYHPVIVNDVIKRRLECREKKPHPTGKPELVRTIMPKFATCVYACKCIEGQEKVDRGAKVFDDRYCIVVRSIGHDEQQQELIAGVDYLTKKRMEKRANYSPSLASWNDKED